MEEMWAQCYGFENYSISSLGRVRNDRHQRIVALSLTGRGVVKVGLFQDGRQYTRSVKVLVAEAYIPGKTEVYNTPLQLDGNNLNCGASNLMWRPRWFTNRYSRQFNDMDQYKGKGPIVDRKTGVVYTDIIEAAIVNGLFFQEVAAAVVNKIPTWPTYQIFDWVKDR